MTTPTITVNHRPDAVTLDVAGVTVHIDPSQSRALARLLDHHADLVGVVPEPLEQPQKTRDGVSPDVDGLEVATGLGGARKGLGTNRGKS